MEIKMIVSAGNGDKVVGTGINEKGEYKETYVVICYGVMKGEEKVVPFVCCDDLGIVPIVELGFEAWTITRDGNDCNGFKY